MLKRLDGKDDPLDGGLDPSFQLSSRDRRLQTLRIKTLLYCATKKQAAKILRMTVQSLQNRLRNPDSPSYFRWKGKLYFPIDELREWAKPAHKVGWDDELARSVLHINSLEQTDAIDRLIADKSVPKEIRKLALAKKNFDSSRQSDRAFCRADGITYVGNVVEAQIFDGESYNDFMFNLSHRFDYEASLIALKLRNDLPAEQHEVLRECLSQADEVLNKMDTEGTEPRYKLQKVFLAKLAKKKYSDAQNVRLNYKEKKVVDSLTTSSLKRLAAIGLRASRRQSTKRTTPKSSGDDPPGEGDPDGHLKPIYPFPYPPAIYRQPNHLGGSFQ